MKISKIIRRTFAPLIVARHIEVLGSALTQVFKAADVEYEPNRAIAPTIIYPIVSITDPDGVIPNGLGNLKLGGIKWYINGVDITTTADYTNGVYSIDLSDTNMRGALTVKKNVNAESPITFEFRASYPDTRKGINIAISINNIMLTTQVVNSDKYSVEIDQPEVYRYNPIEPNYTLQYKTTVWRGSKIIPNNTAGLSIMIQKKVGNSFVNITSANAYEVSVTGVGEYSFDMRLIDRNDYRLIVKNGVNEVATTQFCIVRSYPVYVAEVVTFGDVQKSQDVIPAKINISTRHSVIANAARFFTLVWHTVSTSRGDVTHNLGDVAEIPTHKSGIDTSECEIYCDITEKKAHTIATDNNGNIYTNATNEPFIFN